MSICFRARSQPALLTWGTQECSVLWDRSDRADFTFPLWRRPGVGSTAHQVTVPREGNRKANLGRAQTREEGWPEPPSRRPAQFLASGAPRRPVMDVAESFLVAMPHRAGGSQAESRCPTPVLHVSSRALRLLRVVSAAARGLRNEWC